MRTWTSSTFQFPINRPGEMKTLGDLAEEYILQSNCNSVMARALRATFYKIRGKHISTGCRLFAPTILLSIMALDFYDKIGAADCTVSIILQAAFVLQDDNIDNISFYSKDGKALSANIMETIINQTNLPNADRVNYQSNVCSICIQDLFNDRFGSVCKKCALMLFTIYGAVLGKRLNKMKELRYSELAFACEKLPIADVPFLSRTWWAATPQQLLPCGVAEDLVLRPLQDECPPLAGVRTIVNSFFDSHCTSSLATNFFREILSPFRKDFTEALKTAELVVTTRLLMHHEMLTNAKNESTKKQIGRYFVFPHPIVKQIIRTDSDRERYMQNFTCKDQLNHN